MPSFVPLSAVKLEICIIMYHLSTSIVENATVSVGNESSTAPLVIDALLLLQKIALPRIYSDQNLVLYICEIRMKSNKN